jgi:hypothetical protein
MEATSSSETSIPTILTPRHIQDGGILQNIQNYLAERNFMECPNIPIMKRGDEGGLRKPQENEATWWE